MAVSVDVVPDTAGVVELFEGEAGLVAENAKVGDVLSCIYDVIEVQVEPLPAASKALA